MVAEAVGLAIVTTIGASLAEAAAAVGSGVASTPPPLGASFPATVLGAACCSTTAPACASVTSTAGGATSPAARGVTPSGDTAATAALGTATSFCSAASAVLTTTAALLAAASIARDAMWCTVTDDDVDVDDGDLRARGLLVLISPPSARGSVVAGCVACGGASLTARATPTAWAPASVATSVAASSAATPPAGAAATTWDPV